ncbi:MAG: NAD+ synthase [Candidatus Bipolaricaulota bacterium]
MRVGIGQINAHVGAIQKNAGTMAAQIAEARVAGCDVIVFPELAIPGYSPLDLVWRPGFVEACEAAVAGLADSTRGITAVVGSIAAQRAFGAINRADPSSTSDGAGIDLFNVAHILADGREVGRVAKSHLPSYDVYDERRYFTPSPGIDTHVIGGVRVGINICEDIWVDDGPTDVQASLGASWILNLSASPFYVGKPDIRRRLVRRRATENGVGLVYVNLVGAQDDIIFDGGSFVVDARGRVLLQADRFREGLFVADLDAAPIRTTTEDPVADLRAALELGLRDYVRKNGFARVLLGLSGGIDSAVVAALAAEALGPQNVTSVYLPSEFSSPASGEDAASVASNLGIRHLEISIEAVHERFRSLLPKTAAGLVDENLQPRIRGTLLMALGNQEDSLVLCPANKSEIAMGYNTLYGDTVGALAPIADLYKDDVIRLGRTFGDVIPERIFRRPPSAELRPDQKDEDDLPAYAEMDPMLRDLVESNASRAQLLQRGFDPALVDEVLRRYVPSEYKRFQLPPGLKVTPKAFGTGRRIPITNAYRD